MRWHATPRPARPVIAKTLSADVEIGLDGETYPLKSSLAAATAVSNRFDGFQGAMAAVANSNLAAVQFIVRKGIPMRDITTKDLDEAVWQAGTRELMGPVMKYITRLANGGRDPDLEDADEDGAEREDQGEGNGHD